MTKDKKGGDDDEVGQMIHSEYPEDMGSDKREYAATAEALLDRIEEMLEGEADDK